MSLGGLFGNNTTAAATPATDPGLQPNKFALQMFANGTGGRPSPIGFGTPDLVGQIKGLMPQTSTPGTAPAPTPAAPKPSYWDNFGPLGQFFKMIDDARVKNGETSLADMMNGTRQKVTSTFDGGA